MTSWRCWRAWGRAGPLWRFAGHAANAGAITICCRSGFRYARNAVASEVHLSKRKASRQLGAIPGDGTVAPDGIDQAVEHGNRKCDGLHTV